MIVRALLTGIELSVAYAIPTIAFGILHRMGKRLDLSLDALLVVAGVSYGSTLAHTGSVLLAVAVGLTAGVALEAFKFAMIEFGRVPLEIGSLLIAYAAFKALEILVGESYSLVGIERLSTRLAQTAVPSAALATFATITVVVLAELGIRTRLGLMFRALGDNPELPVALPKSQVLALATSMAALIIGIGGVLQADREGSVFCGFSLARLVDAFIVAELTAAFIRRMRDGAERWSGHWRQVALTLTRLPITIQLLCGAVFLGTVSYMLLTLLHPSLPSLCEAILVLLILARLDRLKALWSAAGRVIGVGSYGGLRIQGLKKAFRADVRQVEVLRGVDAQMPEKGLWIICGGNATGKSTLLRILAGIERADEGNSSYRGRSVPPHARLLHQQPAESLAQSLTVRENLTVAVQRRDRTPSLMSLRAIDDRTAAECLARVSHLEDLKAGLDRPAGRFSGGQIQLLALSAASIDGSPIILADEPTKQLDSAHRRLVERELRRLAETRLVILTSHEPRLDLAPAGRHLELVDGYLQPIQTALEEAHDQRTADTHIPR